MEKMSYQLDKSNATPIYVQLYQQIRQSIHQQQLRFQQKLPSKRSLCEWLQISQNTVESAYHQLLAEGYIEAKARVGYFVSFQAELDFPLSPHHHHLTTVRATASDCIDLNPNFIDNHHFPLQKWLKSGKAHLQLEKSFVGLGHKQGDENLRQQIAHYLSASRGIHCDPSQIIITAGAENAMQQLILLFNQRYAQELTYGMEAYGYATIAKLLKSYKKPVQLMPLKDKGQLDIDFLTNSNIDIAYITPSNIYPFAQVLSVGERQQLLDWANQQPQRYIIEDDYDSEFRYKGKPIPALQSLDRQQKVIYLGSFSKLLMPSLRIGFLLLPKPLLADYQRYCGFLNCAVSRFEQQRLAHFIQQGEFEKHIHRMRKIYRRKMEHLCELLSPYEQKIRCYGSHSGFYLLIELLSDSPTAHLKAHQKAIEQACLAKKIKIYPVDYPNKMLFSLGFANLPEDKFSNIIQEVIQILLQTTP